MTTDDPAPTPTGHPKAGDDAMAELTPQADQSTSSIECHGCGGEIQAPSGYESESIRCPNCSAIVSVEPGKAVQWRPSRAEIETHREQSAINTGHTPHVEATEIHPPQPTRQVAATVEQSVVELKYNPCGLVGFSLGVASMVLFGIGIIPLSGLVASIAGVATFDSQRHKQPWMGWVGIGLGILYTLMYMKEYGHL